MRNPILKVALASLVVVSIVPGQAHAGRGGFRGGGGGGGMSRGGGGGYHGSMGMSGMNGMPPGSSSRGMGGMGGMSGMNGMPPGSSSRGMGGMGMSGMSGMNGMPPGSSSRGTGGMGMSRMSGMNGMPPGTSARGNTNGVGMSGMSGVNGLPPGTTSRGNMNGAGMSGRSGVNGMPPGGATTGTSDLRAMPGVGNQADGVRLDNSRLGPGGGNVAGDANRYGAGVGNAYAGYHSDWYHGGWNGHYGGYGAYGAYGSGYGWGGAALGAGLGSWAYGSTLGTMGYSNYANPYYGGGVGTGGAVATAPTGQPSAYDYSQPIDPSANPPQQADATQAVSTFEQARDVFMAGDYDQALRLTDNALRTMPNDGTIHEFRGLVLFALKRYDEAASVLYAVLSNGPGWDWTTMIGLYPDAETYTQQLRALEADSRAHPDSAADHFLLGYQYLVQGSNDAAVSRFQRVAKLNPNDALSAKLAKLFSKPSADSLASTPPADTPSSNGFALGGTWTANPAKNTAIVLAVQKDGTYSWKVTDQGKTREIVGTSTFANNVLTLSAANQSPLAGKIAWQDDSHFTFQVAGGGSLDPGLSFSK